MSRAIKVTVLHVCRWLGFFALARRLTRDRLRILCYHGFELQDESSFRPKLFMTRATSSQMPSPVASSCAPGELNTESM